MGKRGPDIQDRPGLEKLENIQQKAFSPDHENEKIEKGLNLRSANRFDCLRVDGIRD